MFWFAEERLLAGCVARLLKRLAIEDILPPWEILAS
jgi:hypothetical protein